MQLGMIGLGRMGANPAVAKLATPRAVPGHGSRRRGRCDPEYHQYAPDLAEIAEIRRGRSVIDAWLPDLGAARYERFSSRGDADFANRVSSAMCQRFGGHDERKKEKCPR